MRVQQCLAFALQTCTSMDQESSSDKFEARMLFDGRILIDWSVTVMKDLLNNTDIQKVLTAGDVTGAQENVTVPEPSITQAYHA